jgi:hypothetical protein
MNFLWFTMIFQRFSTNKSAWLLQQTRDYYSKPPDKTTEWLNLRGFKSWEACLSDFKVEGPKADFRDSWGPKVDFFRRKKPGGDGPKAKPNKRIQIQGYSMAHMSSTSNAPRPNKRPFCPRSFRTLNGTGAVLKHLGQNGFSDGFIIVWKFEKWLHFFWVFSWNRFLNDRLTGFSQSRRSSISPPNKRKVKVKFK